MDKLALFDKFALAGSWAKRMDLDNQNHPLHSHHKNQPWIPGQSPGSAGSLHHPKRRNDPTPRIEKRVKTEKFITGVAGLGIARLVYEH
ncbi:unnamed protein product [Cuscuta campestris]|uniref:Uncharacterized protein n=1 Tax=Cuscuta campestris TaxID=132261 RepID=A0A484NCP3_9ASTE|nr:unnamed protein product [Cuscuta campestris]